MKKATEMMAIIDLLQHSGERAKERFFFCKATKTCTNVRNYFTMFHSLSYFGELRHSNCCFFKGAYPKII